MRDLSGIELLINYTW